MDAPKTILIVDDEEQFREIFSTTLTAAGFATSTAASGEEALASIRQHKPDLVLMDMRMPGMDGAEALIKIKSDPVIADAKVMFLTSLGDTMPLPHKVDEQAAEQLGAVAYMKKSEDLDALVRKVHELIG
jgi:CheY-like chemotaxis protein